MCTLCVWSDNGVTVVSSRNMDWYEDMGTMLWVVPRGHHRTGTGKDDPNPLGWTSKYGSVIASSYNIGPADGMNEKGLGAHLLWLAESQFADRDPQLPGVAVSLWAQYFLDNFATVDEAVTSFNESPFQLCSAEIGSGNQARPATVHLQITDSTGDVAIFELLSGKMVITHGKQYPVLTNSPVFSAQLKNLQQYAGFGGELPLPGTTQAADRFVRAAYYLKHLGKPTTAEQAIAGIASVLRNTAQPFGVIDSSLPNISPTIWRTFADHGNLRYFFESTSSPYLVWLNFSNLDFNEGQPVKLLDVTDMSDKIGEESKSLVDHPLFEFAMPDNT